MIEIIYKTNDFVVICKSVGVPSQSDPSGDPDAMTLTSELLRKMGESDKLFLIHRLDRVVGGLLVFARNKASAAALSKEVSENRMIKEYLAVAHGKAEGGEMRDFIYKDSALGKAFVTDKKRAGVKEAILDYSVLATRSEDNAYSLVRVSLKTGRFHQIRVQFASRSMPLVGDKKYGSRDAHARTPSLFATRLAFKFKGKMQDFSVFPNITNYPWSLFGEEKYR